MKENKSEVLNEKVHGYGLDSEWAVYREIVKICGLGYEEFIENETLLTRELLESHYDDILVDPHDQNSSEYLRVLHIIVLGALIL